MMAYGGVDVYIHIFLILTLAGGEWSASRSSLLTPEEYPRTGLDDVEKRETLTLPGLEI
jgi:hypothetical protein